MTDSVPSAPPQHMGPSGSRARRNRLLIRLALGLVPVALIVAIVSSYPGLEFAVAMILSFVPLGPVMLLDGILVCLIFKGFWRRWPEVSLLLLLWLAQTTILLAWTARITASDAFLSVQRNVLNIYGVIIDSRAQETVMNLFWYTTGVILPVVVLIMIARLGFQIVRRHERAKGTAWRVATVLLAFLIVLCVRCNVRELHRMGASLADTVSPSGAYEVRLVPINAFCDVNGVVVFRSSGSTWWHPMGKVGDELTSRRHSVRFVWDDETQVRLLVGGRVSGVYDLTIATDITDRR